MKKSLAATTAFVGALAVSAAGFTPAMAADSGATVFTGTVKVGSAPAKGAYVSLDGVGKSAGQYGGFGDVDATGHFADDYATAGTYVASAYGDNILTTYSGNTVRKPDAKTVTVVAGKTTTWNISAVAAATVKGRVLDAKGHALKGLSVSAWNTTRAGYAGATTDAKGAYVLRGLATGTVSISVSSSSGVELATTKVSAKQGATKAAHTLRLKTMTAKVTGTIKVSGSKVTSQPVTLTGAGTYQSVLPAKSGKVTFSHLKAGTYTVAVDGTNLTKKVTVKTGKTKSFGTISRGKLTTIKGTVKTSAKKRAAGVLVSVYDTHGTLAGEVVTNSKGSYSLKHLVSGKYLVAVSPKAGSKDYIASATVTAKRGKNLVKNINLAKGSTITGYVKHGSHAVEGAWVQAGAGYATTDSHGKYTITAVAPGKTTITVGDTYTGGYHTATKKVTVKKGKTLHVSTVKVK